MNPFDLRKNDTVNPVGTSHATYRIDSIVADGQVEINVREDASSAPAIL
jgi:hypothetical protein